MAEGRSRWAALIVLCVGMLMIVLDSTVVNVALPSIKDDLGFSQSGLAWVVNAYLISFGGLLLLSGRIGDLLSRRDVFLSGLTVFTLASICCGLAGSQEMLIAARFVQGVGGALASAVILGMIFTMFPEPREQAKAIGVFSFVASGGASVGLLLGGVLTQTINWHWIFIVNVPIGIATAVTAMRLLHRDRGPGFGDGADVLGALLITGALMLLVYTIVEPAADLGWGAPRTLVLGGVALALIAGFVARQATARNPLVPLRIFRSRTVTGANLIQGLLVVGMFSMFFLGALYFQQVLGYDALQTGLAFLPSSLVMAGLSLRYTPVLITRFGPRTTLLGGMVAILAGLVWFTRTPVDGIYAIDVLPSMVLMGAGAGAAVPVADDAVDGRRHPADARPRLRPGQHHAAGRRCARSGRARDAVGEPTGRLRDAGDSGLARAQRRLPPRLLGRGGPGRRDRRVALLVLGRRAPRRGHARWRAACSSGRARRPSAPRGRTRGLAEQPQLEVRAHPEGVELEGQLLRVGVLAERTAHLAPAGEPGALVGGDRVAHRGRWARVVLRAHRHEEAAAGEDLGAHVVQGRPVSSASRRSGPGARASSGVRTAATKRSRAAALVADWSSSSEPKLRRPGPALGQLGSVARRRS